MEHLCLKPLRMSHPVLLDLCRTMTFLRHLDLGGLLHDSQTRDSEVLRAISTCMPHLQWLDIAHTKASLSAIRCLLPTEDEPGRGCPELILISLWGIKHINVEFLKGIIIGLPKLICLEHLLMINVLAELTDGEASLGSFNSLNQFRLHRLAHQDATCNGIPIRYDILQKAPNFASICNIADVEVSLERHSTISLTDLLMPLAKLRSVTLHGLSIGHTGLLTVLESKGHQLRKLHLFDVCATVSLKAITRTCNLLQEFTLTSALSCDSSNVQEDYTSEDYGQYGLFRLSKLTLGHLCGHLCTSKMLVALLVSPYLKTINLTSVDGMDDDVMACVNKSCPWGLSTLTSVEYFYLQNCPNITASSLVHLIKKEGTMLKVLHIKECDMVDRDVLRAAVEVYPRPLNYYNGS